jgi:hypothetical protein
MASLSVKNETELYRALGRLASGISDFRRRWARNIEIRLRHQREWMDTRGNNTWPKLTDTYLERKRHNPAAAFLEVLQLTGHLYRSLTGSSPNTADSIIEERNSRLVVGTSDPVATLHHEGRGRLPVRQVIFIGDDERSEHKEALYESVAEIAMAEGFRAVV